MRKLLGAHSDWVLLLGLLIGAVASGCGKLESNSVAKPVEPATQDGAAAAADSKVSSEPVELLNVSYDPTRELWRQLNAAFIPNYEKQTGSNVTIKQSHGGSSSQARPVIDGLEADVVTLAMWPDTDAIRQGRPDQRGLGRAAARTARCPTPRRSCSSSARATRRRSRTGPTWCSEGVRRSSRRTRRPRATAS